MTVLPSSAATARNFSRAADRYSKWAVPQRASARHLAGLLPERCLDGAALDIGCGTGFLVEELRRRAPALPIHAIDVAPGMVGYCRERFAGGAGLGFEVADITSYTPRAPFSLAVSNCCLQWVRDQGAVLRRIAGFGVSTVALAVPVEGSLPELSAAYRRVTGRRLGGLDMHGEGDYAAWCAEAGLRILHAGTRSLGHWLPGGMDALRALRVIGAGFGGHAGHVHLPPAEVRELARVYTELFGEPGHGVPQTYRILFILAEVTA